MKIKEIILEYKGMEDPEVDIEEPEDEEPVDDNSTVQPDQKEPPEKVDMDEPVTSQPTAKEPTKSPTKPSLSMDKNSRMERAKAKGFDTILYHASTHDITDFDASKSAAFNDWGSGIYASNSIDDVNANYAGEGPDLTHRLGIEKENVASQLEWEDPEEILAEYGITVDEYEADPDAVTRKIARAKVMGESEHGVVYPIMVNRSKFVSIGGPNRTILRGTAFEDYVEEARAEFDISDYDSEDDYNDAVTDRAYEIRSYDDDSAFAKVYEVCRQVFEDDDVGEIVERAHDSDSGDIDLTELDQAIRGSDMAIYTGSDSDLTGGAISALVFLELGFEGVIDYTVNRKFGSQKKYGQPMVGVGPDTVHTIIFPGFENRARSVNAAYDHDLEHLSLIHI